MLVPLVLYFLCPCASLTNYFENPLIRFLLSDPLINCFYSIMFTVVSSRTALILRRGLVDGLDAWLVYC